MKKGSDHKFLQAKVFGGGNVLNSSGDAMNMTGINNINFALSFLETEKIPIISNDTGGIFPRKIYFNPLTSKVFLKRIIPTGTSLEQIKEREKTYRSQPNIEQGSAVCIVFALKIVCNGFFL